MFGLTNRGSLPAKVEQEFERLFARLRALWLTEHNEDGTHRITPRGFDFVPTGAITGWSTDTAPDGWVFCRGQQLSRVDYKALFDVIGTTYGAGNGTTTFNVPDLQQRFPLGKASGGTGASLAGTGGAIDHTHSGGAVSGSSGSAGAHTHTVASGGSHSHTVNAHDHGNENLRNGSTATSTFASIEVQAGTGANVVPGGSAAFTVAPGSVGDITTDNASPGTDSQGSHDHGGATGSDGAHTHAAGTLAIGTSGTANPPYLVLNFIILTGVS